MEAKTKVFYTKNGTIDSEKTTIYFQKILDRLIRQQNVPLSLKISGSKAANKGIDSEKKIVSSFVDWQTNQNALSIITQICLLLSLDFSEIEDVKSYLWKDYPQLSLKEKKSKHKTDIFICIKVRYENEWIECAISMKETKGVLNQLDRRWARKWQAPLGMPSNVVNLLKFFTGELMPSAYESTPADLKDERRMYLDEMTNVDRDNILLWFKSNIDDVLKFIFVGDAQKHPPNFLLIEDATNITSLYKIAKMKDVLTLYRGTGDVILSKRGNIYLGSDNGKTAIIIKRKGGDNGAKTAQNLGVSFNPLYAFHKL